MKQDTLKNKSEYKSEFTADGILTKENMDLMSFYGRNYNLLRDYFYLILENPKYYYTDIGCHMVTSPNKNPSNLIARPLKLGDVMILNSSSMWGNYPKSITLSIHGIENYGIQIYYDLLKNQIGSALYSNLFSENFIEPVMETIKTRENSRELRVFNSDKIYTIYAVVDRLKEIKRCEFAFQKEGIKF